MPLVKATLQTQIQTLLDDLVTQTDNPEASRQQFAADLATAIDTYIKTALVSTTVIGTSPSGAVTGTGTGSLS